MQVSDGGAAALGITVVVYGMTKDFGLVRRRCVDSDLRILCPVDEPILRGRVSRLQVIHIILGSNGFGWLRRIQPVDRRHEVGMLPARREVGVKVRRGWLKK